jgi:hypothetical protein
MEPGRKPEDSIEMKITLSQLRLLLAVAATG